MSDFDMDWLKLVAGPLVGALVGGLIGGGAAVIGPGMYLGWRIKKLAELMDALDAEQFLAQRTSMSAEVERMATKLAASYKVPSDWLMTVAGWLTGGFGVGALASWTRQVADDHHIPAWLWWSMLPVLIVLLAYLGLWASAASAYTASHRAEFIRRGMPESYELPPRPRPRWLRTFGLPVNALDAAERTESRRLRGIRYRPLAGS